MGAIVTGGGEVNVMYISISSGESATAVSLAVVVILQHITTQAGIRK